ncbi:hypothetical protein ATDW_36900 (plasmid) [Asticcacaulis sp. DW145]|uniref:hypothetical protein n=1 Tax=Asticcacaulis sp. DW145 TaxID=3095608 RepID=UPI0030901A53|nr:hypothetical protein ATDW_36900 [Asticcacaulis sp. DW145]
MRHEIALTASEQDRVIAMADADGLSVTKWIVALIRARLTGTAQFGQQELEELAQSNLQMLAIGRSLNTLAKAVNKGGDFTDLDPETLRKLEGDIRAHVAKVSNLMTGNAARWRLHGE